MLGAFVSDESNSRVKNCMANPVYYAFTWHSPTAFVKKDFVNMYSSIVGMLNSSSEAHLPSY